ncbi:hypothetical protein FPV67DRAFT_1455657 [Lyophyllum atratum]|nr:hypothetical protein FPV67DRAFT_1455657 [Lyophyllum atratum]
MLDPRSTQTWKGHAPASSVTSSPWCRSWVSGRDNRPALAAADRRSGRVSGLPGEGVDSDNGSWHRNEATKDMTYRSRGGGGGGRQSNGMSHIDVRTDWLPKPDRGATAATLWAPPAYHGYREDDPHQQYQAFGIVGPALYRRIKADTKANRLWVDEAKCPGADLLPCPQCSTETFIVNWKWITGDFINQAKREEKKRVSDRRRTHRKSNEKRRQRLTGAANAAAGAARQEEAAEGDDEQQRAEAEKGEELPFHKRIKRVKLTVRDPGA